MVIVIESDDAARNSLKALISSSGHTVFSFASSLGYLDAAAHGGRSGRPECVILDIHMPEINGLELYGIIKTHAPDVPVIFVSRLPDQLMTEKARSLRSEGLFSYPLNANALLSCINRVARSHNEAAVAR